MKTVASMNLLVGQNETITMSEFRKQPGEVIEQVCMGKTFNITRAGKVVAMICKPEPNAAELGAEIRRLRLG
jgi:antitoxin (DNA-binding transcriptional repressor) of toxin-antitoxin stability system